MMSWKSWKLCSSQLLQQKRQTSTLKKNKECKIHKLLLHEECSWLRPHTLRRFPGHSDKHMCLQATADTVSWSEPQTVWDHARLSLLNKTSRQKHYDTAQQWWMPFLQYYRGNGSTVRWRNTQSNQWFCLYFLIFSVFCCVQEFCRHRPLSSGLQPPHHCVSVWHTVSAAFTQNLDTRASAGLCGGVDVFLCALGRNCCETISK